MRFHLLLLVLAAMLAATPAAAETLSVETEPDGRIRLDLDDVPVEQAADALSQRLDFSVKFVRPSQVRLSGSRSGDGLELLNWLLNGHDRAIFVSGKDDQKKITRVVVFGPSGNTPPPAPKQDPAAIDPMFPDDEPIDDIPPDPGQFDDEPMEEPPPPMDGGISDYSGEEPMEEMPQ